MKSISYLTVFVCMLCILFSPALVRADIYNTTSGIVVTDSSYLMTTLINQDPITAVPGDYVTLTFKVENRGTVDTNDVVLTLIPSYPFSLDPSINATQELGTIRGSQSNDNLYLVKYKVRVDKDAIEGESEINLGYTYNSKISQTKTFNISVNNSQTDFDVINQGSTSTSSGTSTSLAIANIGANDAQAVIMKIPEQKNFKVIGPSSNIVGNLNGGDYTVMTFQIVPANNANISATRTNISAAIESNLTVEISYTDTLGIRRTVQKDVQIGFSGLGGNGNITGRFTQRSQQTTVSNSLLYIGIGAAGIIIVVALIKFKTRKKK